VLQTHTHTRVRVWATSLFVCLWVGGYRTLVSAHTQTQNKAWVCVCVYVYTHTFFCVCVCVKAKTYTLALLSAGNYCSSTCIERKGFFPFTHTSTTRTHTHTHTHTHTFLPASRVLSAFCIWGTNWMWGLTHTGQQMSGSLRLGQLISMTNRAPSPNLPKTPTLQEAQLLSGGVEAMGHRWCWFLWRATVDDCQNALGLVEKEGCRLVQPFSCWTHAQTLTWTPEDTYEYTLKYSDLYCLDTELHAPLYMYFVFTFLGVNFIPFLDSTSREMIGNRGERNATKVPSQAVMLPPIVSVLTPKATSTVLRFHLNHISCATFLPGVYTTLEFSCLRNREWFGNAAGPIPVWKLRSCIVVWTGKNGSDDVVTPGRSLIGSYQSQLCMVKAIWIMNWKCNWPCCLCQQLLCSGVLHVNTSTAFAFLISSIFCN